MRRAMLLILAVGFTVASFSSTADAQSKGRAKKKSDAKVLKVGDEVSVFIIGDEAKAKPSLEKAGVTGKGFLVLPTYLLSYMPHPLAKLSAADDNKDDFDGETVKAFRAAADVGDRLAIARLVDEGRAAKVSTGAKLLVLSRSANGGTSVSGLPAAGGDCRVRIIDGPSAGKIVEIPIRNVR